VFALAAAHTGLGTALGGQEKTDEAIAEFKMAIKLDPSNALAHKNLSVALKLQGKREAADAELQKALSLEQKH
jgi:Flp pilus assembly protein TadD